MLEAIKLVGGIAGLLTTAFVIWDRWARGRPLAWVTAKKFGANPLEYIRIQNPGPVGVFIKSVRAYPGGLYGIAKDRSPGAMMKAQINIDVNVFLGPDDICDLPLLPLRNPSEAARDHRLRLHRGVDHNTGEVGRLHCFRAGRHCQTLLQQRLKLLFPHPLAPTRKR